MTAQQIQAYIQIASILATVGIEVVGKFKALFAALHPGHALTDEQINAIEQAGMLEVKRRQLERVAMGASD